jgi:hypothetical protein
MVYDILFHLASYHEVMSKWFRFLAENFEFIEAVNSQIKNFNLISRWRKVKTFVAYL